MKRKSLPLWASYKPCARCRPKNVALARQIIADFRRGYQSAQK